MMLPAPSPVRGGTLVVVQKVYGEDGGEIREWVGDEAELAGLLARDEVRPFDAVRCTSVHVCGCGKQFITATAIASHQRESRPGRVCSALRVSEARP